MKERGKGLVSIIIRTKNEETWISQCLSAVYAQSHKDIEVILVDNQSTDMTVQRAKEFPVKIVTIDDFKPGKAINKGIEHTKGKYIVCLSGHCIPANDQWLSNLIEKLDEPDIAGVYGRQLPTPQTSAIDARDLYLVFGLDSRSQYNDSFFHNANSAFRREIWETYRFCETTKNIEDRLWGEKVIKSGLRIYYESNAKVFHWHGIHHGGDEKRADNIQRIISTIPSLNNSYEWASKQYKRKICAFIPVLAKSIIYEPVNLLKKTIKQLEEIECINQIYVSTDSQKVIKEAEEYSSKVKGFVRSPEMASSNVSLDEVIKEFVCYLDNKQQIYDLISIFQISYPKKYGSC